MSKALLKAFGTTVALESGKHAMQPVLGNYSHAPCAPLGSSKPSRLLSVNNVST